MIFRKPPAMSTKDRQRPLRMQYLCTIKKNNGVQRARQRRRNAKTTALFSRGEATTPEDGGETHKKRVKKNE